MSKNIDVLLTYGWVRSTYSALKDLSANGLSVAVSDTSPIGMCQLSTLKKKSFKYSSPFKDPDSFIRDVRTIVETNGIKVLIPSHDETEVIAENREKFSKDLIIPIPSISLLRLANNKSESLAAAEKAGINVPRSFKYFDLNDLKTLLKHYGERDKFVIKLRKGNSSKGVFYSTGKEELLRSVEKIIEEYSLSEGRYPVVQEYVSGDGWGVSCLYWEGKRVASFTHKRLREKLESGGTSTLRQQCDNRLLEEMAHDLLDSLKWHGLAMVEFKYDSSTKKGWFIEINPRMWGSISLSISSGVHFPYLLYLCAVKGPETAFEALSKTTIHKNLVARWYLGDLIIAAQKLKQLNLISAFKHMLPGGADCYDDFSFNDAGAFIGEIGYYGYQFLKHRSMNPLGESVVG